MRTTFEVIQRVYDLVKTGALPVFKLNKLGTHSEYVVVNAMPMTGVELKKCFVNVNIHVADIKISDGTTVANTKRLEELSTQYAGMLEEIDTNDMALYYVSQGIEREEALKEHYANIKLMCKLIDL
ncbi:hypothetical protein LX69_01144 [Breznakibacter xylanolyticus]|uniref:Uncharacterized protein n=1 Tax=Breznakibacter xylanolyticus TaxID=990 RepID=A0A2W7NIZ7_9BACT|nr:hypothetical protein [Breznakibacter xylanolyticus]PZX18107.1 hypothetical protein LX69_01144 [Breznakibacter xylanolyticus]